ncbi:MAG: AAA family ATPase [Thermoguttaceae bacterium]|nr:AAA family ATPase [Thermoguttaceae bacterium]
MSVLEELEKRYEGLSPGVKDVLTVARGPDPGPFRQVCGVVADLLRVSVEAAPLVEVALGEMAQCVVLRPGPELLDHLRRQPYQFSGRVGFVWLEPPAGAIAPAAEVDLDGLAGVLGRADRFVETEPAYESLVRRLLARTWFVETLAHALDLARRAGPGWNFVTLAGERLAADGTLAVGPRHTSTGLISRRSELRVLRAQLAEWEAKIEQTQSAVLRLDELMRQDCEQTESAAAEHRLAVEALGEHGHRITAAQERQVQLGEQRAALEAELQAAAREHEAVQSALADARARQQATQAALAELELQTAALGREIEHLEAKRQICDRQATGAKVELAKSEERLGNLRARMRQFQESQAERQRAVAEGREELALGARRLSEACHNVLRAESELAELYLRKEAYQAEMAALAAQQAAIQTERSAWSADAQRLRARLRKLDERIHAKELVTNEVRHERTALADRLREDYGVELAELEQAASLEEQRRRDEVQAEIDDLRQKINQLGNVNLEALEELDRLESRYTTLATQLKDLTDAKNALVRIIEKINADSRKLFAETLETVRGHFVQLFRDLFGGGQAEIVLEEGVDILDSGVEIVARPPGKELRSISLLSGGEKTLTCVALLLALFRSRPSPFCVLDEVDAALDEANIDRFIKVLQDFLAWTQFIIVTHSKKTMTCATTMYGVTMQESGVSKPVSVRFEDVSDDGEILLPAAPETAAPPSPHQNEKAA